MTAWAIASIPFWMMGGGCLFVAVWGGILCLSTDKTRSDIKETTLGVVTLLMMAGILLCIAAWVAS